MAEHPIQGLMKTALNSIKEMVDVNTVIGTPVEAKDGSVIIPVSRVTFGFAAGGGDFEDNRPRRGLGGWSRRNRQGYDDSQGSDGGSEHGSQLPFAGGSGAGVSVQPVGFLVMTDGDVRLITVEGMPLFERLIDMAPVLVDQVAGLVQAGGGSDDGGGQGDEKRAGERQSDGGDDRSNGPRRARRFRLRGNSGQESN